MKNKLSKIIRMRIIVSISVFAIAFLANSAYAGTLSCSVTTALLCTGGSNTVLLRMSGSTNAHAELGSGTHVNYDANVVCCTGVTGLSSACVAPTTTLLKLSGVTNAHSEQNTNTNYANNACISVPTGGTVAVGYGANCTGYDTTIASMSNTTNAHVGGPSAYATKVCASATSTPAGLNISGTVTSSVFDSTATSTGGAGYHSILWNGTLGTGGTGKVRFQLAAADTTTGPWSYYGGATCGSSDWFDVTAPGVPVELKGASCQSAWNNKRYFRYKIQICSNDCVTNGPNTPTVTGVAVSFAP